MRFSQRLPTRTSLFTSASWNLRTVRSAAALGPCRRPGLSLRAQAHSGPKAQQAQPGRRAQSSAHTVERRVAQGVVPHGSSLFHSVAVGSFFDARWFVVSSMWSAAASSVSHDMEFFFSGVFRMPAAAGILSFSDIDVLQSKSLGGRLRLAPTRGDGPRQGVEGKNGNAVPLGARSCFWFLLRTISVNEGSSSPLTAHGGCAQVGGVGE
jgi:hypothetical protein